MKTRLTREPQDIKVPKPVRRFPKPSRAVRRVPSTAFGFQGLWRGIGAMMRTSPMTEMTPSTPYNRETLSANAIRSSLHLMVCTSLPTITHPSTRGTFRSIKSATSTPRTSATFSSHPTVGFPLMAEDRETGFMDSIFANSFIFRPLALHTCLILNLIVLIVSTNVVILRR